MSALPATPARSWSGSGPPGGEADAARRATTILAAAAGAALAYTPYRRDAGRIVEDLRRYSAPDAALCEAPTAPMLGASFGRVAEEVVGFAPGARVLGVGWGPGRLTVKLADKPGHGRRRTYPSHRWQRRWQRTGP